ncbi:MAG: SDR family NAD(P)-dependent oxidoreductase [Alphaproteobacteria bacterium]|nr:SDR family NAD(P)-dependent oxidoreductase [Alphaproteobacteria bacterium]
MDLKGNAAIVTGGASGLGEATAKAFATRGAYVIIADRDAQKAARVASETGGRAITVDVASAESAQNFFAQLAKDGIVPRVLVNCAGIAIAKRMVGRDGPMELEEFSRIINVNLIGTFNMMRLAGHAMTQAAPLEGGERGVIISTASVAAFEGQIGQSAYSASKGGVVALTLPIARELAQFGVRVLAIAPGLFRTPLLAELPPEAQDSLAAAIPNPRRLGAPEEYAALACHMVENAYLNGEAVRIDGALRMAPR